MRLALVGSIQMSCVSPPQGLVKKLLPPSVETQKLLLATSTSSGVEGENVEVYVIPGAPDQGPLPAPVRPALAAVVGSPDRALVGRLYQRVNALRVAGR